LRISRQTSVILIWALAVILLLVGCAEEILAPRELKTRVKINLSAAAGPVDHGWLTIDNDVESRHRMDFVAEVLQSDVIEILPGAHRFLVVAVDAEETILLRGDQADTIAAGLDTVTITLQLAPVEPDCIMTPGTTDFGEVRVGDTVADTLLVANSETALGVLSGVISLESEHFRIVSGGGAYELEPGQEMTVIVAFSPQTAGRLTATVMTGSPCGDIIYSGTGLADTGTIIVNPNPNVLNARWSLVGPADAVISASGDSTLQGMVPGSYTLTWGVMGGWDSPSPRSLTQALAPGGSISFAGTYVQSRGTVLVSPVPSSLPAPWNLTSSGGLATSGIGRTTLEDMLAGTYNLTWGDVDGWDTPAPAELFMPAGGHIEFTGNYVQSVGTIVINPEPDEANGSWVLTAPDESETNGSGDTTLTDMIPGAYTVTWGDVEGWVTPVPVSETREVVVGETTTFTGNYSVQSGVITINPGPGELNAPWLLGGPDGVEIDGSGETTLSDMGAGSYTVTWGSLAGWNTPIPGTQTQELPAGGNISFAGTYVQQVGTIEIRPNTGQQVAPWSLLDPDEVVLEGTGNQTLTDMAVGSYTLTWGDVIGWATPVPDNETLVLAEGATISFQGAYQSQLGTIRIDVEPDEANAPWGLVLDSAGEDTLRGNGDTLLGDMVPGDYAVYWYDIPGWGTPSVNPVLRTLGADGRIVIRGNYVDCLGLVGAVDTPGEALDVAATSEYAYIADGWNGMQIIDIGSPEAPRIVGNYYNESFARAVAVDDSNYAYLANSSTLTQIDVSDPAVPRYRHSLTLDNSNVVPVDVTVFDSYVYVAWSDSGMVVLEISDEGKDSAYVYYRDSYVREGGGLAKGVTVAGNLAYLAYGELGGLEIIDISKPYSLPHNPVGAVDTPGDASDVVIVGGYAYVADGPEGLQVIDIRSPGNPVLRATLDTGTETYSLDYTGEYLLVADHGAGILAVDISQPTDPVIIDTNTTPGEANGISFAGGVSCVADGSEGLRVIDTSCYEPTRK